MRWSQTLVPTLKETPAEAEIASHKLLLRAGLIRKLTGGLYTFLPLGLLALRKIEQIVREEMNRAGALELLMPALQPPDIRASIQRATVKLEFPFMTPNMKTKHPLKGWHALRRASADDRLNAKRHLLDLINAGLLQTPLQLETQYKGERFRAMIEKDGTVVFDGKRYNSLSTAASMARKSIIGTSSGKRYPQTNGWTFWKFRDAETGKSSDLNSIRQRYLRSRSADPAPTAPLSILSLAK